MPSVQKLFYTCRRTHDYYIAVHRQQTGDELNSSVRFDTSKRASLICFFLMYAVICCERKTIILSGHIYNIRYMYILSD